MNRRKANKGIVFSSYRKNKILKKPKEIKEIKEMGEIKMLPFKDKELKSFAKVFQECYDTTTIILLREQASKIFRSIEDEAGFDGQEVKGVSVTLLPNQYNKLKKKWLE